MRKEHCIFLVRKGIGKGEGVVFASFARHSSQAWLISIIVICSASSGSAPPLQGLEGATPPIVDIKASSCPSSRGHIFDEHWRLELLEVALECREGLFGRWRVVVRFERVEEGLHALAVERSGF